MDSIDIEILKLLQQNARVTASQIANEVSLSVPAISERLKKLDSTGIIQKYTIILSAQKMKKNLVAYMFVSLKHPNYIEGFVALVEKENEIIECSYLAGDFDYLIKIITEDTQSLEVVLNRIKTVPGVQKTKTIVTLSTVKNTYSIPPYEGMEI
ncbi:Lrp/AsnC family transcriptional regulator [Acetobacterium woodii]|uniref:AsnC family transcriptional regulator AldR n=1 Tax=Acetobacterium woodii (strain ATCC 29683 / DSM 1030 / JCM 2381 / KCTC 1655 / WB1) TaxID=931626 RepID=H6LDM9_ACEWD|nr:Lrp/AsnC family transcriptional regulator [Acetobacterium woodii]AFA49193.1 AsnC family transcriptional regulator AldR [Acetobacterium woodii DSM 1030]